MKKMKLNRLEKRDMNEVRGGTLQKCSCSDCVTDNTVNPPTSTYNKSYNGSMSALGIKCDYKWGNEVPIS